MSVAANGRMVWVVGGSRGDSTLRTLSYPDLKSREHPRAVPPYQSGWILLSPDGASLAYPVAKERVTDIHCENLDTGEIRALPGEWTWVTFPAWSPDGKKIAFYALKETQGQVLTGVRVFVVDVLSGENRTLTGPFAAVGWPGRSVTIQWPIVWSKASDAVFFHARYGNDPELGRTYRVGLAEIDRPIPISEYACLGTSVRPDTVYVGVHCGIGPVYALSLGTEPPKKTELARGEICYPTISPSETLLAYDDAHSGLVVRRLRAASKPILVTKDFDHSSLFRWVAGPPPPKTFEDPR